MKSIVCKICGNADYFREKNGKLTCLFCGNAEDNVVFEGKRICRTCLEKLKTA